MLDKDVKQYLADRRRSARTLHERGGPALEVANLLCDAVEHALQQVYSHNLACIDEPQRREVEANLGVAALGGFGRRDLAPFSDVDVVFLRSPSAPASVVAFAKAMVREIWDVGLSLGHTLATVDETLRLAKAEPLSGTALLEARFLLGNRELCDSLIQKFRRSLSRARALSLSKAAIAALKAEQVKFGDTTFLLEPNVKKTKGGLRDIQLIRWIGSALFQSTDFGLLEQNGQLEQGDAAALAAAHDWLLRVRADLHFHADKASDVLSRTEQLRIAKAWGYRDEPGLIAVEILMRDYFRHTTTVSDIVNRLLARVVPEGLGRKARDLLLSRRADRGISVRSDSLYLNETARALVVESLDRVLRIADLAGKHQVDLDRETKEELRRRYRRDPEKEVDADEPLSQEAIDRFLAILGRPGAQHRVLRMLHQLGILGRLIPEFEHSRGLLQFNAYHKYTVDEHTLLMIENAEQLLNDSGLLGSTYRAIHRKDLLHLAMLLHDLGKGYEEDHSEVGRRIAQRVARRFRLSDADTRKVVFLVHRHLFLSHLAYRRDTSDPKLWVELTREVGSSEMLEMLYILTAVDTMSVGPGAFTQWKADLLADLFLKAMRLFGEAVELPDRQREAEAVRADLLKQNTDDAVRQHIASLPTEYLLQTTPKSLARHLSSWKSLPREQADVWVEYQPETATQSYTVLTHEKVCEGIFHKICGALLAHQMEILAASIYTLADGTVVDRFNVFDKHHTGPPTDERCRLVRNTVRRILTGEVNVTDVLWSSRPSAFVTKNRVLARDTTRVEVDNDSSDRFTVIDVFTANRRGLLFTLTKGIFRIGLSVQFAKIATYDDDVVDVFYVQEPDGRKVGRQDRIDEIQRHLSSDIRRLAADPHSLGT